MQLTDRAVLRNYKEAIQYEWLETNGLGGWAGSSVIGCNTRRYHGLLVAAVIPPTERMVLVSKLEETIVVNNQQFELGVNNFGGVVRPDGNEHLVSFNRDLFPQFIYEAGGVKLEKTVGMIHGKNTTVVVYRVLDANESFELELLPLLSVRGYHQLARSNHDVHPQANFSNSVFQANLYNGTPDIFIKVPDSTFHHDPNWWFHFHYDKEKERGLDFVEDLFTYGNFSVELHKGDSLGIIISTEDPLEKDAFELLGEETLRRQTLLKDHPNDETVRQLVLAADQFIVKRGEDLKTIIAGYHWFTDWSRDTMIALPGLCLSTGRYDDAKKILAAFAQTVSQGMLPNRFEDYGKPAEYNQVDGTLWYFITVYKYLQATDDREFVLKDLLPVLKDIIEWHFRGTRYSIHVTDDGLLYAGEKGAQLTWMDVKIDDWVVTPRTGKPVEVNALWYNALYIYAKLLELNGNTEEAALMEQRALLAKKSFNEQFWNDEKGYLYDVVNNTQKDDCLRPNQLLAVSLPFPLIDAERARSMLKIITEKLYSLVGLRTLSPDDPSYCPYYEGDAHRRDSCYHQGTVWSWLLGPYIDALMKLGTGKALVKNVMDNFTYQLNEGCIGSVSEIFDAEFPHSPKGCIAQAWGVAEILRVMIDYNLIRQEDVQVEQEPENMVME